MPSIAIIEDNPGLKIVLEETFTLAGFQVLSFLRGEDFLAYCEKRSVDIILSDYKLPGMNGLEILKSAKMIFPEAPFLLMTAHAEVDMAIKALKGGADDYLIKPFSTSEIEFVVQKSLENRNLKKSFNHLHGEWLQSMPDFVGRSPLMEKVFQTIQKVAMTDSSVLISGESGTGKELVAAAIHRESQRKGGPFVRINCASIPETLLESELFGHEKGAFTGADQRRVGRFELAENGTLFLDEIGELPPGMQAKLLRVLQEREIERLGGNRVIPINTRVLSATNKNLKEAIKNGDFREDLFFRLNVIPLPLPPLRERKEDIPSLVNHFIIEISKKMKCQPMKMDGDAMEALLDYSWPGNVRELKNIIERVLVLSNGPTLTLLDIPIDIINGRTDQLPPKVSSQNGDPLFNEKTGALGAGLLELVEEFEREIIEKAFKKADGVQVKTAELLHIKRTALQYKLKKYGIGP